VAAAVVAAAEEEEAAADEEAVQVAEPADEPCGAAAGPS
jgi:hypothetical protein